MGVSVILLLNSYYTKVKKMGLCVEELIKGLKKYDENKKVRILFGVSTQILWIGHEDIDYDLDEGCVLVTYEEIKDELPELMRIDTVKDLLWHLQFFKKDLLVWHNDLGAISTTIQGISDEVKDENGELVEDTVFLINFCHLLE